MVFACLFRLDPFHRLSRSRGQQLVLHADESVDTPAHHVGHGNAGHEIADTLFHAIEEDIVLLFRQIEERALRFHQARCAFHR